MVLAVLLCLRPDQHDSTVVESVGMRNFTTASDLLALLSVISTCPVRPRWRGDADGEPTCDSLVTLFDDYLRQRAAREIQSFGAFDLPADYQRYVDGKPRNVGVKSFLQSRGNSTPEGETSDDPAQETVCGLGNRKNSLFLGLLKTRGVEVFDSPWRSSVL